MKNIGYNTLTAEEIKLACEPLSQDEAKAIERKLYLRSREKKYVMKKMHSLVRYLGEFILNHSLKLYNNDLLLFASQIRSPLKSYKIFLLYHYIRKLRPKVIVEYGSGSSTALISALLELNARDYGVDGSVISFEQNPDFYDPMMKYFPKSLIRRVQINISPIAYIYQDGYRQMFYKDSPRLLPKEVDFVFIDGPAPAYGMPEERSVIFSGDMLRLAKERTWHYACTDIRYFNSMYFSKVIKRCCVSEKVILRSIQLMPIK